jgi:hypothetical protein
MPQFRDPMAYLKPLYHGFEVFCREKSVKELKKLTNNHTFRPLIPGRAAMAILRSLPKGNLQALTLEKMIFTVAVGRPSFLDSIFGRSMSTFDFRSEGYGVVQLHGPIYFKWEMCLSEDGYGPVEGILSVIVGGWTSLDRSGTGIIKECFEPQQAQKRLANGKTESKGHPLATLSRSQAKRQRTDSSDSATSKAGSAAQSSPACSEQSQ